MKSKQLFKIRKVAYIIKCLKDLVYEVLKSSANLSYTCYRAKIAVVPYFFPNFLLLPVKSLMNFSLQKQLKMYEIVPLRIIK